MSGRITAGVAVVAATSVGIGIFYVSDTPPREPAAPQAVSRAAIEAAPTPAPAPSDGVQDSAKDQSEPPPLSFDPAARLPGPDAWIKNAVAAVSANGRPMIAVVIDDVGLDRPRSRRAMALPAPVTIALMAYADDARDQAALARRAGHELIVHLPMEPDDNSADPGPNALVRGLPAPEFNRRLEWNLSQFAGYVGVNNHMGSRLTSDPAALAPVMAALKRRGLLFLDSRTTGDTQGLAVARKFGVPAVERNVFIDHDSSPIAVRTALVRTEDLALRDGFAVAIGHPKDTTLDALEEWLPGLRQRGFAVVPLTAVVRHLAAGG